MSCSFASLNIVGMVVDFAFTAPSGASFRPTRVSHPAISATFTSVCQQTFWPRAYGLFSKSITHRLDKFCMRWNKMPNNTAYGAPTLLMNWKILSSASADNASRRAL